jgi:hypothetical protein
VSWASACADPRASTSGTAAVTSFVLDIESPVIFN